MEIASLFAVIASAFSVGFLVPTYLEMIKVNKELKQKVKEFDDIGKAASEANQSFAAKILQLEEKISTLDFWKNNNLGGKKHGF